MAPSCCSERPRRYLNTHLADIPELQSLLECEAANEWPQKYRCRVCGQTWLATFSPFMHADIAVVYKEGASPDPFLDEDGRDTRQWAAPPKAPSKYPSTFADTAILASALVLGLATLPDASYASRQSWVIGWMIAGVLALAARDFWQSRSR